MARLKLRITKTDCSICGRPLTNAESVQNGVGPICAGSKPRVVRRFKLLRTLDMFKANYDYVVRCDVLVIYDLNIGNRSVTNDIENVLNEVRRGLGGKIPDLVCYRDSEGQFDGILHNGGGRFIAFYPIGVDSEAEAIRRVRGLPK